MNLFRSEEHARRSPEFDPAYERSLQPVATWLKAFSGEMFRNRSRADYVSWLNTNRDHIMAEFMAELERF